MRQEWLKALCCEIVTRKTEMGEESIHQTIYFGGGTPSMLSPQEWNTILNTIEENYNIAPDAERTLEANPEDITPTNATLWRTLGFNRLSIGVQSLNDNALKASKRRHSAHEARRAIETALKAGFTNIGIDFIIGLPESEASDINLAEQLLKELPITHLSLYILSIDEGSILYKKTENGTFTPPSDDAEADMYKEYCQMIKAQGFEHYEISNFAKPGYRSRHNSAYWEQKPYLGFGPAAHSYNGSDMRKWNIANIKKYCEAWLNSEASSTTGYEMEILGKPDRYNELIMTRLRTSDGIPMSLLHSQSFIEYWETNRRALQKYLDMGVARIENDKLLLTEEGWLISDAIFTDLFC